MRTKKSDGISEYVPFFYDDEDHELDLWARSIQKEGNVWNRLGNAISFFLLVFVVAFLSMLIGYFHGRECGKEEVARQIWGVQVIRALPN